MNDETRLGDIIGRRFHVVSDGPIATQGREGCTDPRCTRVNGRCRGWHCTNCGQPSSYQGHALRDGGFSCEAPA